MLHATLAVVCAIGMGLGVWNRMGMVHDSPTILDVHGRTDRGPFARSAGALVAHQYHVSLLSRNQQVPRYGTNRNTRSVRTGQITKLRLLRQVPNG